MQRRYNKAGRGPYRSAGDFGFEASPLPWWGAPIGLTDEAAAVVVALVTGGAGGALEAIGAVARIGAEHAATVVTGVRP